MMLLCYQIWISGSRDQKVLDLIRERIEGWIQKRLKQKRVIKAKQKSVLQMGEWQA
jgi:hypothetical protein